LLNHRLKRYDCQEQYLKLSLKALHSVYIVVERKEGAF
jgi:hypothetical protein